MKPNHLIHDINRRIACGYDFWSWAQDYPVSLDPPSLQSIAREYRAGYAVKDVLDLGCGTGGLLAEAGPHCAGRLVGVDISSNSCDSAREKMGVHGSRATIIDADFLDLTPDDLGKFDLIYCTGVLFILPVHVRDHVLKVIGSCLNDGGIALMSYYAGAGSALRAHLARSLRAMTDGHSDPRQRAQKAREYVDLLRPAGRRPSQNSLGLRAAFHHVDHLSDEYVFAELLNEEFNSISTAELARVLAPSGVEFATYLDHQGFEPWYSGEDRALLADRLDLMSAPYRYAIFTRPREKPPQPPESRAVRPSATEFPVESCDRPFSLRRSLRHAARQLFWGVFRV